MKGRKFSEKALRRGLTDAYMMVEDTERVGVAMPTDIAANPVQSEFWAYLIPPVNRFIDEDIPLLRLLVTWYAIAANAQAELEISANEGIQNRQAERALKNASAEIRALSDLLGLSPLARARIGFKQANTAKTAAEVADMFHHIEQFYDVTALDAP